MPIAVTCQCGSKLEIDEKFLGKQILCPDCQRPLPTQAPAMPPPLELPDNRRVSGFALLSLVLALVGAFTVVGTIAAIAVGVFALKLIADKPTKLEGIYYARAGIGLGAFFTLLTLALFLIPTIFGLDSYLGSVLREMEFAGHVEYPLGDTVKGNNDNHMKIVLTKPPGAWAIYVPPTVPTNDIGPNDLILVNIASDAYIACQFVDVNGGEAGDDIKKLVLEKFYKSELVNLLGRLNGRGFNREAEVTVEPKVVEGKLGQTQELRLDMRLGGIDRTVVLQYPLNNHNGPGLNVLIGVARRNRFDRMNKLFHDTFDSQKEE